MNKRWYALDLFKFMAVFTMIIPHSLVWWLSHNDKTFDPQVPAHIQTIVSHFLTFVCSVPLALPLAAGISLSFVFKNNDQNIDLLKHIKRGVILIALGFTMNILSWGFEDFFTWDVLPFVGLSTIFIAFILKYTNKKVLYIFAFLVLVTSEYMRSKFLSLPPNTLLYVFIGDKEGYSYFPFFPWFSFIVAGIAMGEVYLKYGEKNLRNLCLSLGGAIIILSISFYDKPFLIVSQSNLWGPELYQASVHQVMGAFGIVLTLFGLLMLIPEPIKKDENKITMIDTYSKGIMVLYIVHTVLFYHITAFIRDVIPFSWNLYAVYVVIQLYLSHIFIKFLLKKYKKINL